MPERDLPCFEKYRKALYAFASSIRMTVEVKSIDSDGVYLPTKRKIQIDEDNSESAIIACLLHELGHAIDHVLILNENQALEHAYEAFYNGAFYIDQKHLVVECEERAWANAKKLAKQLKIPLGKWYYQAETFCLNDYKKTRSER